MKFSDDRSITPATSSSSGFHRYRDQIWRCRFPFLYSVNVTRIFRSWCTWSTWHVLEVNELAGILDVKLEESTWSSSCKCYVHFLKPGVPEVTGVWAGVSDLLKYLQQLATYHYADSITILNDKLASCILKSTLFLSFLTVTSRYIRCANADTSSVIYDGQRNKKYNPNTTSTSRRDGRDGNGERWRTKIRIIPPTDDVPVTATGRQKWRDGQRTKYNLSLTIQHNKQADSRPKIYTTVFRDVSSVSAIPNLAISKK